VGNQRLISKLNVKWMTEVSCTAAAYAVLLIFSSPSDF